MAQNHKLTPWGIRVNIRLVELGLTAAQLAQMLPEKGVKVSRSTLSGMMHGYRGKRSEHVVTAINELLGIEDEDVARPA